MALQADWRRNGWWLVALALPPLAAGAKLILFDQSHELACSRVAESNPWLRPVVGRWITCKTFVATGRFMVAMTIASVLYARFMEAGAAETDVVVRADDHVQRQYGQNSGPLLRLARPD